MKSFPSDPGQKSSSAKELETAASRWLARRDRGLTAPEEAEFSAWLASDPRCPAALEDLEGPFRALDRASRLRPNATPDPDLLRPAPAVRRRLLSFPALATVSAAAAIAALGFFVWKSHRGQPEALRHGTVVRHAPERLPLSDGSRMELNAGAQVEIAFTPAERQVRLTSGEALFEVAKNPARPFVVVTGGVLVRAVGTVFSVSHGPSEVDVLVTEGRVSVTQTGASFAGSPLPSKPTLVAAGQRLVIANLPAPGLEKPATSLSKSEIDRLLRWHQVWLEFAEMPLADVVAEFNRSNVRQLLIVDPEVGRMLVSGTFRADGVDALVRLLGSTSGVAATPDSAGHLLLSKAR